MSEFILTLSSQLVSRDRWCNMVDIQLLSYCYSIIAHTYQWLALESCRDKGWLGVPILFMHCDSYVPKHFTFDIVPFLILCYIFDIVLHITFRQVSKAVGTGSLDMFVLQNTAAVWEILSSSLAFVVLLWRTMATLECQFKGGQINAPPFPKWNSIGIDRAKSFIEPMIIPGMVRNSSTLQLEYITMKRTKLMSVNNISKTTNISKSKNNKYQ